MNLNFMNISFDFSENFDIERITREHLIKIRRKMQKYSYYSNFIVPSNYNYSINYLNPCYGFKYSMPMPMWGEEKIHFTQMQNFNPFPYNQNNNSHYNHNQNKNSHHNHNNDFNNINFNNNNNNTQNNPNNNFQDEQTFKQSEHLRGLVNIASTCYMNSTLQCFAHIEELFNYFQKPKILSLLDAPGSDQKLFPVFAKLINLMWYPYDSSPIYPYIFKEKLGQLNPLFQGALPNDAKDLLTFMLMQLHDELNNPKNTNNNNNQNMLLNINMQQDKQAMLNNFIPFFKNNYRSIISGLFYGLTLNVTQCNACKVNLYNYQTFNFLIFPLSQVLNNKMQSVNFQNNFNNTVNLYDCFQYNQIYTPLNEYYCNRCQQNTSAVYANFISASPNILIIILNRGIGLQYKVKIDFEENLDLKNYVEYYKDKAFYELIGVVTHYGESGASGHFMARCRSPIDNYWYLYNDAIVSKIGFFTKENFLQGNPYILFYKKTNFANK